MDEEEQDLFRMMLARCGRRPKLRFCFKIWNEQYILEYILEFQNTNPTTFNYWALILPKTGGGGSYHNSVFVNYGEQVLSISMDVPGEDSYVC